MKISSLKLSLIILFLFISGSALVPLAASTKVEEKTLKTVNCSGFGKKWRDCYQEAEALCPEGYTVIRKSTGVVSVPVNGRYTLAPSKKIVVECK